MDYAHFTLNTPRLCLRAIQEHFVDDIFQHFTQEITTYMVPKPPEQRKDTETFVRSSIQGNRDGSGLELVILDKTNQEFLGCVGVHRTRTRTPELGIWLKKDAHGHRYGLETIKALVQWAETHLEYDYLLYPVDEKNIASRNIVESLGGQEAKRYTKVNMSGNTLHTVEYRIPRPS